MRWGLRFGVVAAGIAGGLLACQVLVGIEDDPGVERFPPLPEAATVDASPDVDPCPHAGPPPMPESGAASPETALVFAVRRIRLGGHEDLPTGYDFDGICSCENRDQRVPGLPATSCKQPGEACVPGRPTDDSEGRDLGGSLALSGAGSLVRLVETNDVNPRFDDGRLGILLKVEGFNESDNDRKVTVSLFPSPGIELPANGQQERDVDAACQGLPTDGGAPVWTPDAGPDGAVRDSGVDAAVRDTWFVGGSGGGATGTEGYVTGGLLVVNGSKAAYEIPIAGRSLRQTKSIFVAKIAKGSSGRWTLRGNLVGLVSAAGLLNVVGLLPDPLAMTEPKPPLCANEGLARLIAPQVCSARDLLETSEDPTRACDAVAFAIGIEAEEAALGKPLQCPVPDASVPPGCVLTCDTPK